MQRTGAGVLALVAVSAIASADPPKLAVMGSSAYGPHLVDASGRAIYMFTPDQGGHGSTCYDECAKQWPPVLAQGGAPQLAGKGLDPKKLGTAPRKDGGTQVTYAGWPLYYFVQDRAPGETQGQAVYNQGGSWFLLSPSGEVLRQSHRDQ